MWTKILLVAAAAVTVWSVELGEETAKPAPYRGIPQQSFVSDPYHEKPDPYNFGYETKDEYGTTQTRQETGDESGAIRGTYGYSDPFGVYRQVEYIADEYGFRANIKTNEPSASNQNPADVTFVVEQPPAQVAAAAIQRIHEGHHQPPRRVVPVTAARPPAPIRGSQQPIFDRRPARPTVTRLVLPTHHSHPTITKLISTGPLADSPQTVSKVVIPSTDHFHQPVIKVVSPLELVRPQAYKPYGFGQEGQFSKERPQFSGALSDTAKV